MKSDQSEGYDGVPLAFQSCAEIRQHISWEMDLFERLGTPFQHSLFFLLLFVANASHHMNNE